MDRTALSIGTALLLAAATPCRAAGDIAAGRLAFTPCASCHQVGPSARAGFGPQLDGVIGRPAGSTTDYAYSPAMKSARFVWSQARLAEFIKNPDHVVPGTKMRFSSFGYDDRKIADLLAYLGSIPARQPD